MCRAIVMYFPQEDWRHSIFCHTALGSVVKLKNVVWIRNHTAVKCDVSDYIYHYKRYPPNKDKLKEQDEIKCMYYESIHTNVCKDCSILLDSAISCYLTKYSIKQK